MRVKRKKEGDRRTKKEREGVEMRKRKLREDEGDRKGKIN